MCLGIYQKLILIFFRRRIVKLSNALTAMSPILLVSQTLQQPAFVDGPDL